MGSSTSKKENKDDVIQMNNLNKRPIQIHNHNKNPIPQKKVDKDELKEFERLVHAINNNISTNLNIISKSKEELNKISREINNEFNFQSLIKNDFDNTKTYILFCNLNENEQKALSKLEWSKDKSNQEEKNKEQLIKLIKKNRYDILKLIENN